MPTLGQVATPLCKSNSTVKVELALGYLASSSFLHRTLEGRSSRVNGPFRNPLRERTHRKLESWSISAAMAHDSIVAGISDDVRSRQHQVETSQVKSSQSSVITSPFFSRPVRGVLTSPP